MICKLNAYLIPSFISLRCYFRFNYYLIIIKYGEISITTAHSKQHGMKTAAHYNKERRKSGSLCANTIISQRRLQCSFAFHISSSFSLLFPAATEFPFRVYNSCTNKNAKFTRTTLADYILAVIFHRFSGSRAFFRSPLRAYI
jgi:hypothetical protein